MGVSVTAGTTPSAAAMMVGLGRGFVITASAEAIVGNPPVDDAGVASGLPSTAIQVGGILALAAAMALFVQRAGTRAPRARARRRPALRAVAAVRVAAWASHGGPGRL